MASICTTSEPKEIKKFLTEFYSKNRKALNETVRYYGNLENIESLESSKSVILGNEYVFDLAQDSGIYIHGKLVSIITIKYKNTVISRLEFKVLRSSSSYHSQQLTVSGFFTDNLPFFILRDFRFTPFEFKSSHSNIYDTTEYCTFLSDLKEFGLENKDKVVTAGTVKIDDRLLIGPVIMLNSFYIQVKEVEENIDNTLNIKALIIKTTCKEYSKMNLITNDEFESSKIIEFNIKKSSYVYLIDTDEDIKCM